MISQLIKSGVVVAVIAGLIILLSINHQRMMRAAEPMKQAGSVELANAALKKISEPLQPTALPSSLEPSTACNIESVGGVLYTKPSLVSRGEKISIIGWLLDSESHTVPDKALLYLVNEKQNITLSASVILDRDRDDVARLYGGLDIYRRSGFELSIDTGQLEAGDYHLYLSYNSRGRKYACDNGRILRVNS